MKPLKKVEAILKKKKKKNVRILLYTDRCYILYVDDKKTRKNEPLFVGDRGRFLLCVMLLFVCVDTPDREEDLCTVNYLFMCYFFLL